MSRFNRATVQTWDLCCCVGLHSYRSNPRIIRVLALISRLGNGLFWYLLMALILLLDPVNGAWVCLQMLSLGVLGVLIYKLLKRRFIRRRPYQRLPSLTTRVAPLDAGSFPSGHTLHAVGFSVIAGLAYPWLAPFLILFSGLTAIGRVILGLHYPSDVMIGALIGLANAGLILHLTGG